MLANQNLTLAEYRMPARRNSAKFYDAGTKKPAVRQQRLLIEGAVSFDDSSSTDERQVTNSRHTAWTAFALLSLAVAGWITIRRRNPIP